MAYECVLNAWNEHSDELEGFLTQRADSSEEAEDLLQEVFTRAMQEGGAFCELSNARSWLFRVARNQLIDAQRLRKNYAQLHESDIKAPSKADAPISQLQECITRNLPDLEAADQHILEACDLEGMTQNDYAAEQGLSLPATKARLRRARQRLRTQLVSNCQVVLDEQGKVCCHRALPVSNT
ncbi:RNA polymerase sigma (SigZ) subunit [Halospina denitrificans]|uniref:RNA polymerase sigma (SigZ) subunit n=1 Tax=Halospina denitrificans TaxID=332522 RepID=A0A4R7K1E6_9GAMM|nr:sigma-70 family RNA polymerase sigma factor [Halospina denitrificans]TDT44276.1 RNA polymerase sigma (SigZ) subunit [Halospina denitrificans]